MRRICILLIYLCCLSSLSLQASAHPGHTDGSGGHRDRSTGEYHYHHGYSAHDHYDMDGDGDVDCPYGFDDKTSHADAHSNQTVSEKTGSRFSFWDLASALISSIGPAFCISLLWTLILANIIFLIFGDDIGWTITKIAFFLIFTIACYQFVSWDLA